MFLEFVVERVVLVAGKPVNGQGACRVVVIAFRKRDAAGREELTDTIFAWSPVDVRPVVGGDRELRCVEFFRELDCCVFELGVGQGGVKQLLPRGRME